MEVFFIITIEIHVFNANSVDPNQMPHSVVSDLGLHCLPVSPFIALSKFVAVDILLLAHLSL